MTLAELKRFLQPGTALRNTYRMHNIELTNTIVTVEKNTSVGLQIRRGKHTFFMDWPKASCLKGAEDSFTILRQDGEPLVAYEIVPPLAHIKESLTGKDQGHV